MRFVDIVASMLGLVLLSPLFFVLALLVKLGSSGPVLFCGRRVGRNGETFGLYKFRSMFSNADKSGPAITASGDSRVTPIGRFLRRYKLDELPQLINVLKGDMSLVGPRPEDPRYVALYTPEQRKILSVRPGITGLASLHYRNEEAFLAGDKWESTYIERVMPHKLSLELNYLSVRTLRTDLELIIRTVCALGPPVIGCPQTSLSRRINDTEERS